MNYADLNQVNLGSLRKREIAENDILIRLRALEAVRAHLHALFGFFLTKNPHGLTSKLKGFLLSWLFGIPILSLKASSPDRLQMLLTDTQTHRNIDTYRHRHTDT